MAIFYGRGDQCQFITRRARRAHLRASCRKMWGRTPAYLYKSRVSRCPMPLTMEARVCGLVRVPELNPGTT